MAEFRNNKALLKAAKNGHTKTVQVLLENGANVHTRIHGKYPLYLAAKNGHTEIVKLLLENWGSHCKYFDIPLRYAANGGHTDTVRVLLENGEDIHHYNNVAFRWVGERSSQPLRSPLGDRLGSYQ